jgi:hypothetical protein
MTTHLEITTPLFHLIVWSSVLLLCMLSTVRKIFLAVLGLRHVRQKWLSNFPSSRHKSSVSQPMTELTNRCFGVRYYDMNRRKRTVSSPVSLLLSVYPAVCHFKSIYVPPLPLFTLNLIVVSYTSVMQQRHLCPWQTGGSRLILHRVLCTYLAVFQDRHRWPAVVSAVVNIRVA